jgi:hypothetical protein
MKTLLDLIVEFVYPLVIGFLVFSFLNGVNFNGDVKTAPMSQCKLNCETMKRQPRLKNSPHEGAEPSAAPRE